MLAEVGLTTQDSPVSGVQIWLAHLDSLAAAPLQVLAATLDPAERARGARFRFEADRKHYIASRGLLRRLLSVALDKPASMLVLEYGTQGKPAIGADLNPGALRFNLSHSAGWAMFALARDREIGIDLESGLRLDRDGTNLSGLAARILSKTELDIWSALPDPATRRAAFLRAWTRKEALAKATGKGVFDELSRFELILDAAVPSSSLVLRLPGHAGQMSADWLIHDLSAPAGFAAALALEQKAV